MAIINVAVSKSMKAWVQDRVRAGGWGSVSNYIRDLVRRDEQRAEAWAELHKAVTEELAHGASAERIAEVFDDVRRRAKARGLINIDETAASARGIRYSLTERSMM